MDSDPSSGPYGASIIYIEVSPKYLRWTVILAVAPMVPPLFIPVHLYSPWSSTCMLLIWRSPDDIMLTLFVGDKGLPFLVHLISGTGCPVAWQDNRTELPMADVLS
jgi:hypothetical protein